MIKQIASISIYVHQNGKIALCFFCSAKRRLNDMRGRVYLVGTSKRYQLFTKTTNIGSILSKANISKKRIDAMLKEMQS